MLNTKVLTVACFAKATVKRHLSTLTAPSGVRGLGQIKMHKMHFSCLKFHLDCCKYRPDFIVKNLENLRDV